MSGNIKIIYLLMSIHKIQKIQKKMEKLSVFKIKYSKLDK